MNSHLHEIRSLMEVFDSVDYSLRQFEYLGQFDTWQPMTQKEQKAFNALTAKENRDALKVWYSVLTSLNPVADQFRRILERAVGEELPLKGGRS